MLILATPRRAFARALHGRVSLAPRLAPAWGLLAALPVALAACASSDASEPEVRTTYGAEQRLGNGTARAYVTHREGAPHEIGVALSESALEGLPAGGSGHHGGHTMVHERILELPEGHGTPFTFVELNWNPSGHEPEGVYLDIPHFDFHFYTVPRAERDAIDPADPQYAAKAERLPAAEFIPAYNQWLGPPGAPASAAAVPKMGLHWNDVRSPELQGMLGNPSAHRPFTATFIHGSWDGRVHFWEPMVTRAHILEKKAATDPTVRDEVIRIPLPARYQLPGYYPDAYRIRWDAAAKEYRISLTGLAKRG